MKGIPVAQAFVQGNAYGGREVQAAGGTPDGDVEGGVGICVEDGPGQAAGFGAKDQKQPPGVRQVGGGSAREGRKCGMAGPFHRPPERVR